MRIVLNKIFTDHVMATTSGGFAIAGLVAQANVYLQAIAFIVSIIAGCVTIYSWWTKRQDAKKNR
jgi:hypothetical protein